MSPLLLIVLAVVLILAVVVALRPSGFNVKRSAAIAAAPAVVFAEVNDFRKWNGWSPWEKVDPTMQKTFDGASSGAGASYRWKGSSKVGSGKMTISESRPPEFIRIRLEFYKPMPGICDVQFHFKPEGGGTLASWEMTGDHNFIAKFFCLFMDMDKMIGSQYELGLAQLKGVAEAGMRK